MWRSRLLSKLVASISRAPRKNGASKGGIGGTWQRLNCASSVDRATGRLMPGKPRPVHRQAAEAIPGHSRRTARGQPVRSDRPFRIESSSNLRPRAGNLLILGKSCAAAPFRSRIDANRWPSQKPRESRGAPPERTRGSSARATKVETTSVQMQYPRESLSHKAQRPLPISTKVVTIGAAPSTKVVTHWTISTKVVSQGTGVRPETIMAREPDKRIRRKCSETAHAVTRRAGSYDFS